MLDLVTLLTCVPAVFLVGVCVLVIVNGAIRVANGGFLSTAFGALAIAIMASVIMSSSAVIILDVTNGPTASAFVIFYRSMLAAVAQPTITGIALLATVVLLSKAAFWVASVVEDIQIVVESHSKGFGDHVQTAAEAFATKIGSGAPASTK